MNYFKAAPIAALVLFGSLVGCSSEVARPMTMTCGMPRQTAVQRISELFTQNGYQVTSASVDAGTVTAMANTAGGGYEYNRRMWAVTASGNDMIVNASVVSKMPGSSEEIRYVDQSHMMAGDASWFQPVMNGLSNICSGATTTVPSTPGTIESTPRR